MCDYVNKNELIEPREIFSEWISNVQSEIREEYGITFSYNINLKDLKIVKIDLNP